MVLNSDIISNIQQAALTEFDDIDYLGFSNDGTTQLSTDDDLTGEFLRNALTVKDKDTTALTYEFDSVLGLTEGNSETLSKFGLFKTSGGSDLQISKLLTESIAKTSDKEVNIGFQISVEVTDETS